MFSYFIGTFVCPNSATLERIGSGEHKFEHPPNSEVKIHCKLTFVLLKHVDILNELLLSRVPAKFQLIQQVILIRLDNPHRGIWFL
mmetsp:Transcript_31043/g.63110  ORF Transcript_31043/g.63110 Transcript_31043/m.63110 type:complete len:86 (-) Transcript_31043:1651-1908(-)